MLDIGKWKLEIGNWKNQGKALTQCSHFKAAPRGGLVSPYRRGPQKKLRLGFHLKR